MELNYDFNPFLYWENSRLKDFASSLYKKILSQWENSDKEKIRLTKSNIYFVPSELSTG